MLLKRAINNLLYNALAYNDRNTQISVCVEVRDWLRICIADNGKGINEEELENLFVRYYRGASPDETPAGSGLGMAIAKHIIELHGGSIFVNSGQGNGTSFVLEFPLKK